MPKKYSSGLIICLLFLAVGQQIVRAQSDADADLERNRGKKIKTDVYQLESSGNTKIVVRLENGTKLKGYLTKINEDTFEVTDYKTGQTVSIAYRDVRRVEKQGLSRAAKYTIGIGVASAVVVLVVILPQRSPVGAVCPLGCR